MFVLFYIIIFVVLSIVEGIVGLRMQNGIGFLTGIFWLATIVPLIALGVRRLHDRDMSGWFMLLQVVPLANIALLVIFCLEGTRGNNQYGPDPKGIAS